MTKFLSILTFIISVVCINTINAQSPNSFNYQAIVRQSNGEIIANQIVSIKISILSNSVNGVANYVEFHRVATNDYGLINIQIGLGSPLMGSFNNIQWANNSHYIKTEIDEKGGNNYVFLGVSQLLSVPYALNAKTAENVDDADADPLNEIQEITRTGNEISLSKNGGTVSITDNDNDSLNEIQTLALTGNQLSISKGNTITLNGAVDLDADPTNELQTLSLNGRKLEISQGNYIEIPFDNDNDSLNEIQSISFKNDTVFLSKSNHIVLPDNKDNDPKNELQILSLKNDTLYLSQGNYVVFPKDNDTDPTNELQNIEFKNDSITISNGKGISLKQLDDKLQSKNSEVNFINKKDLQLDSLIYLGGGINVSSIHEFVIDESGNNIILFHLYTGEVFKTNNLTLGPLNVSKKILIKYSNKGEILWYKLIDYFSESKFYINNDTIYLKIINSKTLTIDNRSYNKYVTLKILPNGEISHYFNSLYNDIYCSNIIMDKDENINYLSYDLNQLWFNKLDKNLNHIFSNKLMNSINEQSAKSLDLKYNGFNSFFCSINSYGIYNISGETITKISLPNPTYFIASTLEPKIEYANNSLYIWSNFPAFTNIGLQGNENFIHNNPSQKNLNIYKTFITNEYLYFNCNFVPNTKNEFLKQLIIEPINKNSSYIFKMNLNGEIIDYKTISTLHEIQNNLIYKHNDNIYNVFKISGEFISNEIKYPSGIYVYKAFSNK